LTSNSQAFQNLTSNNSGLGPWPSCWLVAMLVSGEALVWEREREGTGTEERRRTGDQQGRFTWRDKAEGHYRLFPWLGV
jgi:hypothetical protein